MIPADLIPAAGSIYRARLFPWAVMRLLPNCQRSVLARFRKRNAAEEYVRFPFREAMPTLRLVERDWVCEIVFDPIGV
jgi:hypothetical protein